MDWIAGVDGFKGRWCHVQAPIDDLARLVVGFADTVTSILEGADERGASLRVLAIDVPVGLPDRIEGPGRAAEQAARRMLRGKTSSVFSLCSRSAAEALSLDDAKRLALATSQPPRSMTLQAWNILPGIRQVDKLMRDNACARRVIRETHPELIFCTLNGGTPVQNKKKTQAGFEARAALLLAAGIPKWALTASRAPGCQRDDLIDALACLVCANAIAKGEGVSFPDPFEDDAHGIPIAIWSPMPQTL